MRAPGRVALLVILWLLAWGEISVGNILSGIAVATALLVAFPPGHRSSGHIRVSARGVAHLTVHVMSQLVISNVVMARQILRRHPDARPGVIAHRLGRPSEEVVTVMTSVIALSPGTMTADVDPTSSTVYVHFFRLHDVAAAHASLAALERLVLSAITTSSGAEPAAGSGESP